MFGALDIKIMYNKVAKFISFEAPRTGNLEFAKYFNNMIPNAVRVTHYRDIVVHLPI